jgi:putative endonuclease
MPLWDRYGSVRQFAVYVMSNPSMTLYIGVTNDLLRRAEEHKSGEIAGFTQLYHCNRLVYYELFEDIRTAIAREKELKGWKRSRKIALVKTMNLEWRDLTEELYRR